MMNILFETKLKLIDYWSGFIQIFAGLIGMVYFGLEMSRDSWGGPLFYVLFFLMVSVQSIRVAKIFILLPDRLIVRRPLSYSTKTDVTFKKKEVQRIIFRTIKGKYGGPHIIIHTTSFDESYRIDLSDETLHDFINNLEAVGIKVINENLNK